MTGSFLVEVMFYLLLVGLFWKVSFQPSAFNPSLVSWKLTAEG
jgi:hypothetical protein